MKTELVQTLTTTFEAHAQQTEGGIEYWLARDIQHLLGYNEWRNFTAVITKAKTACEVSGHAISDHFVDVNKTIQMPKTAEKEIPDLILTRYACYLDAIISVGCRAKGAAIRQPRATPWELARHYNHQP